MPDTTKTTPPEKMTPAPDAAAIDKVIDAAAALVGVTIDDTMRPSVRNDLTNSLRLAGRIGTVGDEAAPAFRP